MRHIWSQLRRCGGAICLGVCLIAYPLWATIVFSALKILLVGWALWQTYPTQQDGRLNIIPPVARSVRWAQWILEDLSSVATLDPMVVGATRGSALTFVATFYACAALVSIVSLLAGLHAGRWICRLALKPNYWTCRGIKSDWRHLLRVSLRVSVLHAYWWVIPVAALAVMFSRTIEGGAFLGRHVAPSLGWTTVILCAPMISGVLAIVRTYRERVRAVIGAPEQLCDCGYECLPGHVCPECGERVRELPAELRWRLPRWGDMP